MKKKITLCDMYIDKKLSRGKRLFEDFKKAEEKMLAYGIIHTIVVFGSARTLSPEKARADFLATQKALDEQPDSPRRYEAFRKAKNALDNSRYYEESRQFGRLVGQSGQGANDCRVTLMTGGGSGIMEAANRGAHEVGAKSIGLNIKLPHEQSPNPYITPDLHIEFRYFSIRKLHFMRRARALLVFPGGFGTLDELFEVLTLIQTKKSDPIPVILIDESYWKRVIDFALLAEEGMISSSDLALMLTTDTAEEAWQMIIDWYEQRGVKLF